MRRRHRGSAGRKTHFALPETTSCLCGEDIGISTWFTRDPAELEYVTCKRCIASLRKRGMLPPLEKASSEEEVLVSKEHHNWLYRLGVENTTR